MKRVLITDTFVSNTVVFKTRVDITLYLLRNMHHKCRAFSKDLLNAFSFEQL